MTPRKAFFIFDYISANIALVVFVVWIMQAGTPLGTRLFIYFLSFIICSGAFVLRWLKFKNRPQPSVVGRALLPKLLLGNGVGLGFMVMFYLQGLGRVDLELMATLIFVGGNIGFFMEWLWQKSYLRRSGQTRQ